MIRIITDSACDITQAQAKEYGIEVLPLHVRFGEKEYLDGIDLPIDDFYRMLKESEDLPKTSLISPGEFTEVFEKYKDDEIICVTVSSKLSGCYQSAKLAKTDNVYLVDSKSAAFGMRMLIELGLKLIKEGKSAKEAADVMNAKADDLVLVALLDTLEYLKKGGRIPAAVATVGTLLSIKPIIWVNNGEVEQLDKARGIKGGKVLLNENVTKYEIDTTIPYSYAYSGLNMDAINNYMEETADLFKINEKRAFPIGTVIGTHVGPGGLGFCFFKKH